MTFSSQRNDTALVFVVIKLCFYKCILHWAPGTCSHSLSRYLAGRVFHESCRISVQWLKRALWDFCFYMSWAATVCLFDFSDQSLVISQKSAAGTKAHLSSQVIIITELWAQFFLFTMTFVRLKRKQSFHSQSSQRRNTSRTVWNPPHPPVCRVGELISSPSLMTQVDSSGFFFATSALSQEFPEGKWDVTFTDKLIMSKELQQQREATFKAL